MAFTDDTIIHFAVAVVVFAITNFGSRLSTFCVTDGVRSLAVTDPGSAVFAGAASCATGLTQLRPGFIDLAVTVVVLAVAHFFGDLL